MRDTTHLLSAIAVTATLTAGGPAVAADLKVTVEESGGNTLLPENASCIATADGKSAPGPNKSAALSWSKGAKRHTLLRADNGRPRCAGRFLTVQQG